MTDPSKLTSYEAIVEELGAQVHVFEYTGSYQGDIVVLLEKDGLFAHATIGYGSCSGCDALESVRPWNYDDEDVKPEEWQPLLDLAKEVQEKFVFRPAAEIAEEVRNELDDPNGTRWYVYDSEIRAVLISGVLPVLNESAYQAEKNAELDALEAKAMAAAS